VLERAPMMKLAPISLALALSLSGCADSSLVETGDGGGGSPGTEQPEPERRVDPQGTYRIHSTFDVATNMPGNAGVFVNSLIAATDDPDDPMSWIVDQMLAEMQPSTFKNLLVGVKPFVIGYLNDQVIDLAPKLVGTIKEIGRRMADLSKELGINEKLWITIADQTYVGRVTADGVRFKIEGSTVDVLFADHDIDDVVVDGIYISLEDQTRLKIGEHTLPLPYGKIVRLGLDAAIIPAIDPAASNLADLLDNVVDCQRIGTLITNEFNIGSATFWAGACLAGLDAAAGAVYKQIMAPNTALDLDLAGSARAVDSNDDFKVDKLSAGEWAGSMSYAGTPAALAQPATFFGARL
jgi:hypothetical protein